MTYVIEIEQEADGRWLGEIPDLPGVMAYGETPERAAVNTEALALRVLADRVEHDELPAGTLSVSFSLKAA